MLAVLSCLAAGQAGPRGNDAPLPNASELLQRAIANEAKLAAMAPGG